MYIRTDMVYPNVREGYYEIDIDGNVFVKKTGEMRKNDRS